MSLPLEPAPEDLAAAMAAATARVGALFRGLGERPVDGTGDGSPPPVPAPAEAGRPLGDVLEDLFEAVIPRAYATSAPGFFGYVPGGPLPIGCLAAFVGAAANRFTGVEVAAPGPVALEARAIRWLVEEVVGLPPEARGVLTSGGSTSNFLAVVAARERHLGDDLRAARAYVSAEAHASVDKALRLAGLPPAALRRIPTDAGYRLDPDALAAAIAEDRAAGRRPFLVVATAGTVNTGAVDPLGALADLARGEGLWLHVDAAYGGFFRLVPGRRPVLAGIERADSVTLDPHKGLFLPYGAGALLLRDAAPLQAACSAEAAYAPEPRAADFTALSIELTRPWRGLHLWLPLAVHGVRAFREALGERAAWARGAAEALAGEPGVEVAHPPELSLFAFRQRLPGAAPPAEDAHNRALLERVNASGRVLLSGTTAGGRFWLRLCVLGLRTDAARVRECLDLIRGALAVGRDR